MKDGLVIYDSKGREYTEDAIAKIQSELEKRSDSRAAFEAWANARSLSLSRVGAHYADANVELAWEAWQAAR